MLDEVDDSAELPMEDEEYSDEFTSLATSFLDESLPAPERIEALKAAIQSCMDTGGGDMKKPASKDGGLALVFGGGGGKKKGD
jgi:hypothetical protein